MEPAVAVEGAEAGYGNTKVVRGLSLRVEHGTMFALLGPSGCGKTTLLASILARKRLEGGEVRVMGGRPGDRTLGLPGPLVGYMPQGLRSGTPTIPLPSLSMELTIHETFSYFGRLLSIPTEEVERRREDLLHLLHLSMGDRQVGHLSGGQQRRLSLALALLHRPRLLVLDEPTVGVDPVMRASIWAHLVALTKGAEPTTIIITTHYVEEARGADRVGFMRGGVLLAEDAPQALLETHGTNSLEEVFLNLCQVEDLQPNLAITCEKAPGKKAQQRKETPEPWFISPSASNIAALLTKNWIRMKRSPILFVFVFFLPGIFMTLSCTSIGLNPTDLPIGVINHEGNCSEGSPADRCEAAALSCYYLAALNQTSAVRLVPMADRAALEGMARRGELRGTLTVPRHFTHSFLHRILTTEQYQDWLYYWDVEDTFMDREVEQLHLAMDTSNPGVALVLREAVFQSLDTFFSLINQQCGQELEGGTLDLMVVEEDPPSLGREGTTFQHWIVPALLALSFFFQAMCLTSEAFITERAEGLLERSWLVGVLSLEIVISFILSQFLVIVVQVVIACIVVFAVFRVPCDGPAAIFVLLCLLQGVVGMSYGFFLSTVSDNTADAMKLSISSFFPVLMVCGVIWPLEGMPHPAMAAAAWTLPQTAAMQGMRDVTLRGWGLEAAAVHQGLLISSAWALAFLLLSWALVRRKL